MKGQLSMEYLLISLVMLSLISLSIAALLKIKENADIGYNLLLFNATVNDIHNNAEELCALGSGNKRTISLQSSVEIDGNRFASGKYSLMKQFTCPITSAGSFSGEVTVENDGGQITINKP